MVLGKGKWKDRVVGWLVETFRLAEWEITFKYVQSGDCSFPTTLEFSSYTVLVNHVGVCDQNADCHLGGLRWV